MALSQRKVDDVDVVESDDYVRDLTMELICSRIKGLENETDLMSVASFLVFKDIIVVTLRSGPTRSFLLTMEEVDR